MKFKGEILSSGESSIGKTDFVIVDDAMQAAKMQQSKEELREPQRLLNLFRPEKNSSHMPNPEEQALDPFSSTVKAAEFQLINPPQRSGR